VAEIKSLASISAKWGRVTPQRTEDYRLGIQNPRRDWKDETIAASARYKLGVDAAQVKNLFSKGVERAGTAKWKEKALAKGPTRFAEGVIGAEDDYSRGFAPYREVINALDLPPRFPKGDPRNILRVGAIAKALADRRTSLA